MHMINAHETMSGEGPSYRHLLSIIRIYLDIYTYLELLPILYHLDRYPHHCMHTLRMLPLR
uniref:Uncharacterized protein n=1 Tax=Picea glauca TaxID=3330 RepID=A0A101M088_PICGL|nr:hypothetical protein ABT39_MTgene4495 [Picea glauca]QHR87403.1 hypothetical protein Q903MT_gene1413 [Picea sitchensis]